MLLTSIRVLPIVRPSTTSTSEVEPGPPRCVSMARDELPPDPEKTRLVPPGVLDRRSTSRGLPSTMVIRPWFSNLSSPTNLVSSLALKSSAARSVPPSSLTKRSVPPPKSLVFLALNSPPAMFLKVSPLPVRSTKPVMSPVFSILVRAPSVSMASPLPAEILPLLMMSVEVAL